LRVVFVVDRHSMAIYSSEFGLAVLKAQLSGYTGCGEHAIAQITMD
jgi:hypothetical protein